MARHLFPAARPVIIGALALMSCAWPPFWLFFFSSRRRHTGCYRDWSSDVCSSDLPEFVLDEGGALTNGLIAGVSAPVAVIGIAEKGYVTVGLTARAEGGHSSMPPDETAVGILAAAILRLEHDQMPRAIRGPTAAMFDYLGPEMSFGPRLVIANRWLLGGLLAQKLV